MTGAHALHVVAALLVLLSGAVKTWSGAGRRNPRAWQTSIAVCRTFWHYLLGVWIFLFLFVSTY
jgi:cytochrome c oxidase subunit 3